jgi:hypothetical protein
MSIVDLDVELQAIKVVLTQARQDLSDVIELTGQFKKIIKWYERGDQPEQLIIIDDVEQNREDYDLWAGRATTFADYMGLLGYSTLGFLESIFRSRNTPNIFTESLQRLEDTKQSLSVIIATKNNEYDTKKEELIQAMLDYHTVTL